MLALASSSVGRVAVAAARTMSSAAANVPLELIKELRARTGAGIMAVKNALLAEELDVERAEKRLRAQGAVQAGARSTRQTSQGVVAVVQSGGAACFVEVNSETDFVARTPDVGAFAREVAAAALRSSTGAADGPVAAGTLDAWALPSGVTVRERLTQLSASCGENVRVSRVHTVVEKPDEAFAVYLHNKVGDDCAQLAVGVRLRSVSGGPLPAAERGAVRDAGYKVAMHVAFAAPQFLSAGDVPESVLAGVRDEALAQVRAQGKPAAHEDKAVQGRVTKWLGENVLAQQPFALSDDKPVPSVADWVKKSTNGAAAITNVMRWRVGELA